MASKCFDDDEEHQIRKFNFLASLLGYSSAFGLFCIGNFRISENLVGHLTGKYDHNSLHDQMTIKLFLSCSTGVALTFPGMAVYEVIMVRMEFLFKPEMKLKH